MTGSCHTLLVLELHYSVCNGLGFKKTNSYIMHTYSD